MDWTDFFIKTLKVSFVVYRLAEQRNVAILTLEESEKPLGSRDYLRFLKKVGMSRSSLLAEDNDEPVCFASPD